MKKKRYVIQDNIDGRTLEVLYRISSRSLAKKYFAKTTHENCYLIEENGPRTKDRKIIDERY